MTHHNQDRVLTLVLQIKEPAASEEIWDAHGQGKLLLGSQVLSISNGDKLSDLSALNEIIGEIQEYLERHHLGDERAEALLDKIEAYDNNLLNITDKMRAEVERFRQQQRKKP